MPERTKPVRRVVSVEFWRDDKVLDNFTPEDKLFMLYLLTNPQSTQLGVYNINKKTMAYELGYSIETITVLLDRFERVYDMIRYSQETHEIAIKNYLRHSILAGGKPVEDLLRKEIKMVKSAELLDYAFQNVLKDEELNDSVRAVINEYYESSNESYHESSNESSNESPTNRTTNRTTNRGASIINNHISNINITNTDLSSSIRENNKYICSEQSDDCTLQKEKEPTLFEIPLKDGTMYAVVQSEVDYYKGLYPDAKVEQEYRGMIGWSNSNPQKRKTRRGIKKFINGWLSRAQENNGAGGNYNATQLDRRRNPIPTRIANETII